MARNRIVPYLNTKISTVGSDPVVKISHKSDNDVINYVIQPDRETNNLYDNELVLLSTVFRLNSQTLTPINLGYGIVENNRVFSISAPYKELMLEYILFNKIYNDIKHLVEIKESFNTTTVTSTYKQEVWGE